MKYNLESIEIFGKIYNDVIFFDNKYNQSNDSTQNENSAQFSVWSKKYGLLQYTDEDGITFTRIDLNKPQN